MLGRRRRLEPSSSRVARLQQVSLAGGAGGLIGSILAKWVGDHHAHYLQAQMDRGGLILWVRTWDAEDERRAVEILRKHSGDHVHVHALPAGRHNQSSLPPPSR